ncbi:hypothetical protein ACFE04_006602 [Oxalis oulophora]
MRNAIRCCISCILPCGALDVIRIVHSNGRVEEISGGTNIQASEIMKAYPKHVLKKPSSPSDDELAPKIVVVPPEALLQRGKIYFLMPSAATGKEKSTKKKQSRNREIQHRSSGGGGNSNISSSIATAVGTENVEMSDRYLSEILSEKVSTSHRDRRRGRVNVWRPHLESISESIIITTNDLTTSSS